MKKRLAAVLLVVILLLLSACGPKDPAAEGTGPFKLARCIATEFTDDGWAFQFVYHKQSHDDNIKNGIIYTFYGINLRYEIRGDFLYEVIQTKESQNQEKKYKVVYSPGILVYGNGSAAQRHDMDLIESILDQKASVKSLLALKPEDYQFEDLDKDMFFRLMREALTSEPHKESAKADYWDLPYYSVMSEQEFIDGYRFHVAHLAWQGCLDAVYIDIFYEDGSAYGGYRQLSDLVEEGKASAEQQECFKVLEQVMTNIRGTDDLLIGEDDYKDLVIGEVDFSRLHRFLQNIEKHDIGAYSPGVTIISEEEIT